MILKYLFRILALPFVLIIGALKLTWQLINLGKKWILNGGEVICYEKDQIASMKDIYNELKKLNNGISTLPQTDTKRKEAAKAFKKNRA